MKSLEHYKTVIHRATERAFADKKREGKKINIFEQLKVVLSRPDKEEKLLTFRT